MNSFNEMFPLARMSPLTVMHKEPHVNFLFEEQRGLASICIRRTGSHGSFLFEDGGRDIMQIFGVSF